MMGTFLADDGRADEGRAAAARGVPHAAALAARCAPIRSRSCDSSCAATLGPPLEAAR